MSIYNNVKNGILVPYKKLKDSELYLAVGKYPNRKDDIAIGPNNKNGINVNNGEFLRIFRNGLEVYSAEPMFNGVSPASLLYGGANPNAVFAAQERWKRINRIRDDGTKYKNGGDKYITKLTDDEEKEFQRWYKLVATNSGLDLNPDSKEQYYDYRGYWKNTPKYKHIFKVDDNNHFPDTYKVPGHPTFSDESIYSSKENPGGHWEGDIFFTKEQMDDKAVAKLAEDYAEEYDRKVNWEWDYHYKRNDNANEDYYPKADIIFDNVNTNISKFLDKRGVTKGALKSIKNYASHFNLNPYSLLSGLILENGDSHGGVVSTQPQYYGLLHYGERQVPGNLKISSNDRINTNKEIADDLVKNIGLLGTGKERDTSAIRKRINYRLDEVQKIMDKDTISTSIGAYARTAADRGWNGINPKQKGYTLYDGRVVKNSYEDMINSASNSLQEKYPELFNFKFGGTHINNQGNMRTNKRKKAQYGSYDLYGVNELTLPKVDKPIFYGSNNNNNRNKGLITGMDWASMGTSLATNLATSLINQVGINKLKAPKETAVLLSPTKLKTRININPQLARMREAQSKLEQAALAHSASSRTRFSRIADSRYNQLENEMNLLGQKENQETGLINQNLSNIQNIMNQTAANIIGTNNRNRATKVNSRNEKIQDTVQNWGQFVNGINSMINGERGLLARMDNRVYNANNLAAMSVANPYGADAMKSGLYKDYYNYWRNNYRI